jgi:hypothetical protein
MSMALENAGIRIHSTSRAVLGQNMLAVIDSAKVGTYPIRCSLISMKQQF